MHVDLLVNVDDILITGNNGQFVNEIISKLFQEVFLRDLGDVQLFLVIKFTEIPKACMLLVFDTTC